MAILNFQRKPHFDGFPFTLHETGRHCKKIRARRCRWQQTGAFRLVDCFSSDKGNNDKMFLDSYESAEEPMRNTVVHVANPADPAELEKALTGAGESARPRKNLPNRAGLEVQIRALIERNYETADASAAQREHLHTLIERTIIARALAEGMSQRTLAARLNLSRTTLRKRIEEYGIE